MEPSHHLQLPALHDNDPALQPLTNAGHFARVAYPGQPRVDQLLQTMLAELGAEEEFFTTTLPFFQGLIKRRADFFPGDKGARPCRGLCC